jgi:hypothetical protein
MPALDSLLRPSRWLGAVFALLLVLAGCGGDGGVDSGGTGGAASFASGPITGFGSVIVAGVHFDETSASVQDADGNAHSANELSLGTTVEVRGGPIAPDANGNDAATARTIVITSAVLGPVEANDVAGHTLTVLGQTVDVTDGTVFEQALAGGQAALVPGDTVEIYGAFVATTGRIVATRIERRPVAMFFALRGAVSSLDTVAHTFAIGGTRFSYLGQGLPAGLANARVVRVVVVTSPLTGRVWNLLRLASAVPVLDDGRAGRLEGVVSAFTSTQAFSVNGVPVDASQAQFPNGGAGLALGAAVKVEGQSANGILVATQVEVEGGDVPGGGAFDVRGAITALDSTAQTFVVHGVTVSYAGTVDIRKGTASDLAVGRQVEARGTLSADGTHLDATRIDFLD